MNSFALVIFGITGNLAQIKLIPVLYDMAEKDLLPKGISIIGIARRSMTKSEFQDYFHKTLHLENIHHKHEIKEDVFKTLASRLPNVLIYRIQPNEGIVLRILTKVPGHEIKLEPEYMQYCYRIDPHTHYIPDPYERLLIDTIRGDQTFFNGAEEVDDLLAADSRSWLEPSMEFCRI